MAFVQPEENEVTPAPVNPAQNAPVSSGGAGVGGATKQAASAPGQNVPAQPSAQLSAYLSANQPQAAAFGQNVAGQLGSQVNAVGQGINTALSNYGSSIYSVPTNPQTTNGQTAGQVNGGVGIQPRFATAPVNQSIDQAVSTSPSSLNAQDQATYEQQLTAAQNAPSPTSTFETSAPYSGLVSDIQNAVNTANLWNSGNNVANLSTALTTGGFEGPNATTGDTTLDSLLLSQTPAAYFQIQNAVAPAANLQGQLNSGATQADASLQNAIANDQSATAGAQQAAQTYAQNLTSYLNGQVATNQSTENAQQAENNTISNDIATGNLTAADAAALGYPNTPTSGFAADYNLLNQGITQGNPVPISPIDLESYLSSGEAPSISAATVATPQNYSDVAALQSILSAGDYSLPEALPINSSTATQAGLGLNPQNQDVLNSAGLASTLNQDFNSIGSASFDDSSYINEILSALGYPTNAIPGTNQPPVTPPISTNPIGINDPGTQAPPTNTAPTSPEPEAPSNTFTTYTNQNPPSVGQAPVQTLIDYLNQNTPTSTTAPSSTPVTEPTPTPAPLASQLSQVQSAIANLESEGTQPANPGGPGYGRWVQYQQQLNALKNQLSTIQSAMA